MLGTFSLLSILIDLTALLPCIAVTTEDDQLLRIAHFLVFTVLARQPAHIPAVRFLNFEGQPEAVDLVNRYATALT